MEFIVTRRFITLCLALIGIIHFGYISGEEECLLDGDTPGSLRLKISCKKHQTDNWVTKFTAYKDDSEFVEDDDMALDISQGVVECNGRRTMIIRGYIHDRDPFMEKSKGDGIKRIRFHPKSGSNAEVVENGRTVRKIQLNETGYGLAITNRPLKDNELFEVKLVQKSNYFKNSLGIGVTPHSPNSVVIPKFTSELSPPSWSMYYSDLYRNTEVFRKNYGRSLDTVEVGDRVGIMRRNTGALHYFVNGVDLGVAAKDIPPSVYGVIELYANAAMATIVNRSYDIS